MSRYRDQSSPLTAKGPCLRDPVPHYLTPGVQRNAVRTHTCEVVDDVLDIALAFVRTFAIHRHLRWARRPREALLSRHSGHSLFIHGLSSRVHTLEADLVTPPRNRRHWGEQGDTNTQGNTNTQYNRQTTSLHSHWPLASGCRRGMQSCNATWCGIARLYFSHLGSYVRSSPLLNFGHIPQVIPAKPAQNFPPDPIVVKKIRYLPRRGYFLTRIFGV